ncbi:hypothetical protein FHS95_000536 [Sphingomonas naasensis]|nr:DUF4375 domain-containing protein [Sphingomonas naasensis]NIJ18867.1 hypothetical protein [Sphingomonas naasensis]
MPRDRITEIRLSPGASAAHEADEICLWADYFVSAAIDEFGYEPDELPEGAEDFTHLWKYHGEVLNGGHAQYGGNTDGDVSEWSQALRALQRLGRPDYEGILADFIRFSIENEERIYELYEEDEAAATDLFRGFDERFYALERQGDGLRDAIHAWLVQQEWLIVDRTLPAFTMGHLRQSIPPHPLLEERRAARRRRNIAENSGTTQAFLRELLDRLRAKPGP